jgi:8-oxo-dGTP diphosphatase
MPSPRIAARAVILHHDRLLLVNAWPGEQSDLWCAPGGGVERGSSLPDNLVREVYEETGLTIAVAAPCLVNEFHDLAGSFLSRPYYRRNPVGLVAGPRRDRAQTPSFFTCGNTGSEIEAQQPAGHRMGRRFHL